MKFIESIACLSPPIENEDCSIYSLYTKTDKNTSQSVGVNHFKGIWRMMHHYKHNETDMLKFFSAKGYGFYNFYR